MLFIASMMQKGMLLAGKMKIQILTEESVKLSSL